MTTKTITARPVDIYVIVKGEWKLRTTVFIEPTGDDIKDANRALGSTKHGGYGIAGTRPRLGEATSKSGKRFRAVPTV